MDGKIIADVQGVKLMDSSGKRVIARLASKLNVEVLEKNQRPFTKGVWTKVKTPQGKQGWVNADNVDVQPE